MYIVYGSNDVIPYSVLSNSAAEGKIRMSTNGIVFWSRRQTQAGSMERIT